MFLFGLIVGIAGTLVVQTMFWGKIKAYVLKEDAALKQKLGGGL